MRAAQIQLTNYFVSELQFAANRGFDADAESTILVDDLQVIPTASPRQDSPREWQITLRIALNAAPERNAPYTFLLEMIGFIHVDESVTDERVERFARINGTSLVFAAAREIIKAATSRGPFPPLLLPTVTFWEPKKEMMQTPDDPTTSEQLSSDKKPPAAISKAESATQSE